MIIGAASLRVLPELAIFFQAIDRPRIGIMVVEVADLVCYGRVCQSVFVVLAHCHVRSDLTGLADADPARTEDDSQPISGRMRAFLLATSEGQRARLMLPTGVLSDVEFPVTSKYVVSAASGRSSEFLKSVSRATVWKDASVSFHSTLAFSIQKLAS